MNCNMEVVRGDGDMSLWWSSAQCVRLGLRDSGALFNDKDHLGTDANWRLLSRWKTKCSRPTVLHQIQIDYSSKNDD